MATPMIDFFEGKMPDYSDTEVISEEVESDLAVLRARKAKARDDLNGLRIETYPITGEQKVFFTKDRAGRKVAGKKPTPKAQPASAENPSWGTFA